MKERMLRWEWYPYQRLSTDQLYSILALRQRVFIVEQRCPYLDADGYDVHAWHLTGLDERSTPVAYLRLIDPGRRFPEPSIGRVMTHPAVRGKGFGIALMKEGLRKASELYPGRRVRISAQRYLEQFYSTLGFVPAGKPYDEDGILHIEMVHGAE